MAINRRSTRKIRLRPAFVGVVFVLLIVLIVVLIVRSVGGSVESGGVRFQRDGISAIVVRDERVISMAAYGKISYEVPEGASVAQGDPIAEVSRMGYDDNVKQNLLNVQREIFQYQIETKWADVNDKSIEEMQTRVATKYKAVAQAMEQPQRGDFLTLQRELEQLLEERNELLRNKTLTDAKLTDWYQKEKQFSDQLTSWKEYVVADANGKISFDLDEYAPLFRAGNLDRLSASDVETALKHGKIATLDDVEKRPLYRIVQPDHWYLAIATSKRDNYYMGYGMTYTLELNGFYDGAFEGTVVIANHDPQGSLYVLEITSDVTPVLQVRQCRVNVSGIFSGYTIPQKGVKFDEDGNATIAPTGGGEIAVEILSQDDDRYLFRSDSTSIRPGMRFEKP